MKVLLVDDEQELVVTMGERMELRGIEVKTAQNGSEALEYVQETSFDIVVLDMKMPGMSGLDTLGAIKARNAQLPVIVLTGHGSIRDGELAMKKGAADYLIKPIDLPELIEKINAILSINNKNS